MTKTRREESSESRSVKADGTVVVTKRTVVSEVVISPYYGRHAGKSRAARDAPRDAFGNAAGTEFDLSPDHAFKGDRVAVLQLYTGEGFTFASPKAALERKGFTVTLWTSMPDLASFDAVLDSACQLWIISTNDDAAAVRRWTVGHLDRVQKLVDEKKGLFIWGDNDPYNADANRVLRHLRQTTELSLAGNYHADKVVELQDDADSGARPGFAANHLITTGLESIYEGITIASVVGPTKYRTMIRASDGKPVTVLHDRKGVRIMIDGGFTRLFDDRWARTAGTARFVTNAACWLFNWENRVKPAQKAARAKAKANDMPPSHRPRGGAASAAAAAPRGPCRFGHECTRADCWFDHPPRVKRPGRR